MKKTSHLTPGEYELMEILWPLGEASVKDIWSRVKSERSLAYTTVMTVLEKMYRKGILARRKKGKAYLYSSALSREEARKGIVDHICSGYFGGSFSELSAFIANNAPSTPAPPAIPPAAVDQPKASEN
jgi:predicted transcriptional regulator